MDERFEFATRTDHTAKISPSKHECYSIILWGPSAASLVGMPTRAPVQLLGTMCGARGTFYDRLQYQVAACCETLSVIWRFFQPFLSVYRGFRSPYPNSIIYVYVRLCRYISDKILSRWLPVSEHEGLREITHIRTAHESLNIPTLDGLVLLELF